MGTHGVKVVIIYPRPQDELAFEKAFLSDHVPLMERVLKGLITRLVLTKVTGSPQGNIAAYRLAEVYFSSMKDLRNCIDSEAGKEVIAHGQSISTGGQPLLLILRRRSLRLLVKDGYFPRTSFTLSSRDPSVKGFCRKAVPGGSSPE
jgi:uncharacterized protein (TIGR02118 family)